MNQCLSELTDDFNSKNDRKRRFSYETKALMTFVRIRRMDLRFFIMKRKEIIMLIHFIQIEK